jgi:hypothetical protein
VIDRNEELQAIENYPTDKIKIAPPAFCTISLQSELSGQKRDFPHSQVIKKWKMPTSKGNYGRNLGMKYKK